MPRRGETSVQSVGRALDVLDLLRVAPPEGARVTDLALRLGVDAATVSRTLATLASRGYASRLTNRRYALGPACARLPERWLDRWLASAGPPIGELARASGETVYLVELLGATAVTIAAMRPAERPALACERGPSFPLWATAAGFALLAPLTSIERVRLLPPEPYPAFTPLTPRRWSELDARVHQGAASGVFAERGCFSANVECLAASVAVPDGGVLALAMSFPEGIRRPRAARRGRVLARTDVERVRLGELLRETQQAIVAIR